jgi:hypothetical protein
MRVFDASSIIYAWDNYPIRQFPSMWDWIATQVKGEEIVMPVVALDQTEGKAPECAKWLKNNDIKQLQMTNAIVQEAMRIKKLLGIENDKFHPKGVDESDILIVASARIHKSCLVSDEGRQQTLPEVLTKCKIPTVCAMKEVNVSCINFIEFIKRSNVIFR